MNQHKITTVNAINYSITYLSKVKNILTSLETPASELMWGVCGMLGMLTSMLVTHIDEALKNPETMEHTTPLEDISEIQRKFNNALDDIKATMERRSPD